jgi:hypothetical protein
LVYLLRLKGDNRLRLKGDRTCVILVEHNGAGGGCSPTRQFFSPSRRLSAGGGDGFLYGVAANEIARVAFVDRHGSLHPMRLTHDQGFVYTCRSHNGCVDVVKAVNVYDRRGRLVSHQDF